MIEHQNVRPLGSNILVKKLHEERTAGSIILPEETQDLQRGTVLAVSPELFKVLPYNQHPVRVGDTVMYLKQTDQLVAVGEEVYLVPFGAVSAIDAEPLLLTMRE